jgi:hypothetical protein
MDGWMVDDGWMDGGWMMDGCMAVLIVIVMSYSV